MKAHKRKPAAASSARQCQQVPRLDEEVLSAACAHEADECEIWLESSPDPWECEDDGRRLACLGGDGNRLARAFACRARVDHAPEKIQEGTHGFSDVTGRQIPEGRLEMVLDAIWILDDEQTFERADEPGRIQ